MTSAGAATRSGLRAVAPIALGTALAFLTLLPFGAGAGEVAAPHLTLALVYYWSIHRPGLMPPLAAAGLGLIQDLLWGGPPGLNLLILVMTQSVLAGQAAFFTRRPFAVAWAGFTLVMAIAAAAQWAVASLYYSGEPALGPLAEQALLTVAVYPLLGWLFARLDRVFDRFR